MNTSGIKTRARAVGKQVPRCRHLGMLLLLASVLHGQFYFGRNKIQYEQFDWRVLSTPHFQIYYYPDEEPLAQAAAFWAEETFYELEQKFNHTLARQVPLVIYSNHLHFQQTNITPYLLPEGIGGFFEYIKGRVVLPNNGSMYDFRRVVRHELVHVFMHAKINTKAREIGVWEQRQIPLWFTEGLAEWWSTGWDTEAEMVIRDALLNDHLIPLENLTLAGAGFLAYKEGQSFLRYLEQNYGQDRIRQLLEEFYYHDTFEDALAAVTGTSYRKITQDWKFTLKQNSAEALAKQAIPGQRARPLTKVGANVGAATYRDAAGKIQVVYLSTRDGYTNIYRQDLNRSREHIIVRGERTPELESLHFLQSGLSISKGSTLALAAKSYERDVLRLIDLETLQDVGEFSHSQITTIRSPAWSPDGKRIVFSAQDRSGQTDLYLWTTREQGAVRLTHDPYLDQEPCFSPDGRFILFSSDRGRPVLDGGANLFLLEPAHNQFRQITSGSFQDQRPRWSSENPGVIHFISDRSGTPNIWRITLPADSTDDLAATIPLESVTNLHTGVVDLLPMPEDSLLITAFQRFSFQLQMTPAGVDGQDLKADPLEGFESTGKIWIPPQYDGEITGESRPYRLKYSLDIAQTAVAYDPIFGFLGGAQLSVSDMLGNHYYHFLLFNTAQTSSEFVNRFNFAVTTVNLARRVNHAVGMFRFANEYYDPYQGFFFEKTLGLRGAINYPLDVFKRVELSGSLWQSRKSFYGFSDGEEAFLLSNYFSFVHDNSLWHPVGPIDGWRLRVTAGLTYNFSSSQIHNYTALLDNRTYLRLARWLTFAQRSMLWYNTGTDIRRFYIGGSWGLRGYRLSEVFGRKYLMLNQELRFPFAQSLVLNLRSFAIGMAPIRGALFFDVGKAWEAAWEDDPRGFIGSYGIGFRGLFLGGLVLRLDIGKRTDFHSKDSPWFSQFFFGWDY